MATIRPFRGIRPRGDVAGRVAALPYDVYNRKEASEVIMKEELSFLKIDRAETQFGNDVDAYDDRVYRKAKELLDTMIEEGIYITDGQPCYYIYELTMDGRAQTGIVACASIDDYQENIIKKHENTRADKEVDRIKHVDTCNAQTGPIFLAYRSDDTINHVISKTMQTEPVYHFVADDGVKHVVWIISNNEDISTVQTAFGGIGNIYIADGHHRAASAVKVGIKRRDSNPGYSGEEEFNFFLSVLFPDEQLMIMPYNRVVKDLNGHSEEEYIRLVEKSFDVKKIGADPYSPTVKGKIGMYLNNTWYELTAKDAIKSDDPVDGLDVSILQNHILSKVLAIKDPKTDERIDFIGGIRGLSELEKRCAEDMTVAFSMYATSIDELFAVSDADKLMPPKSTWFEPKLRSGLFIHQI